HVDGGATRQTHRCRQAIDQHVVPLIEYRDSPVTVGKARQGELAIRVALGEREILTVRITKAHVALGEREAAVVAAAVETLIRRAAAALGRDRAFDAVVTAQLRSRQRGVRVRAVADIGLAAIDDRRVGKADGYVESGRPVFLEEARLADAQEGIVRLLAI